MTIKQAFDKARQEVKIEKLHGDSQRLVININGRCAASGRHTQWLRRRYRAELAKCATHHLTRTPGDTLDVD